MTNQARLKELNEYSEMFPELSEQVRNCLIASLVKAMQEYSDSLTPKPVWNDQSFVVLLNEFHNPQMPKIKQKK